MEKLKNLNGLFIPSYTDETPAAFSNPTWDATVQALVSAAKTYNDEGVDFPVYISGTSAVSFTSKTNSARTADLQNHRTSLSWTDDFDTDKIRHSDSDVFVNLLQAFSTVEGYTTLATLSDKSGDQFVAVAKDEKYPIYLIFSQFETVYNFYPHLRIPHSSEETRLAFSFSKFFTNLARENDREYPTLKDQYDNIIWSEARPVVTDTIEEERFYFQ